jgi:hypothetical protein
MPFPAQLKAQPSERISPAKAGFSNKTEDSVKTGDVGTAMCIGVDDKGRVKMENESSWWSKLIDHGLRKMLGLSLVATLNEFMVQDR